MFKTMPLSDEAREGLERLWREAGPKSAAKLWERARREKLPVRRVDVDEFVRTLEDNPLELFRWPRLEGKAFTRGPRAEWKVDLIEFARPSATGNRFILVRQDPFSRDIDCVALPDKRAETTAEGLRNMI